MEQKNNFLIPASIILAGFIIAIGIYLPNRGNAPVVNTQNTVKADIDIAPISDKEHILGDPNAPIVIVEFSDTECPFCKMFHVTMKTIIDTYGKDGKVAWAYRHFPIAQLHPKAAKEAEATECVNELGGNVAFWKFVDTIYANTPANNGLDAAKLPEFAKTAGVDVNAFNTCLSSGRYTEFINGSVYDAQKAGANGTPYSVMILKDKLSTDMENIISKYIREYRPSLFDETGKSYILISNTKKEISLSGALPLDILKFIIDTISK